LIDENVECILYTNADDLLVNLVTWFFTILNVKRKIAMDYNRWNGLSRQRAYIAPHNKRIE
jgi:hypothetical protein